MVAVWRRGCIERAGEGWSGDLPVRAESGLARCQQQYLGYYVEVPVGSTASAVGNISEGSDRMISLFLSIVQEDSNCLLNTHRYQTPLFSHIITTNNTITGADLYIVPPITAADQF